MGYKILDRKNTGENANGVTESICAVYCDREEDLPALAPDAIAPGSWAWIAESGTFATLKTNGEWEIDGGSTPATTSYETLTDKPRINNVELSGNKSLSALGIQAALVFDITPTENSTNPVTSGGLYTVIGNINSVLEEVL